MWKSWETKRMPQVDHRNRRATYRSTHPKVDLNKTQQSSYGVNWLQKDVRYCPTELDNIESAVDSRRNHKICRENHKTLDIIYSMLIMRWKKQHMSEGIELPNQEKSECSKKKTNLQILEDIGSGLHETGGDEGKD